MPLRPPTQCPTCRQPHSGQRCPRCDRKPWADSQRSGSTRAWRRLRLAVFDQQDGLCAVDGCLRLAAELDHIVSTRRGGDDSRDNVQGLCVDHHREKTQRESMGEGRRDHGV